MGHDASRTGAPVLLLSFLRWMRARRLGPVELLLCADGPLVPDYRSLVPTTVLSTRSVRGAAWAARALHSVGARGAGPADLIEDRALRHAARGVTNGIVVANTTAALRAAAAVAGSTRRLVCHVHELDHVLARVLPDVEERRRLFDRVDVFVAAGEPVARMLVERHDVASERVRSVVPFVDLRRVGYDEAVEARRRLTSGAARSIVASVGPLNPRKGPDRFLDLLVELDREVPDLLGLLVGTDVAQPSWGEVRDDRDRLGLIRSTALLSQLVDPLPTIAAADVIVSTAREDPFPLVLLEAAALGTPVVTFDSGGFGKLAAGLGLSDWVVPIGDTLAARDAVLSVLADPDAARSRVVRLQDEVIAGHSVERLGPELWDVIVGSAP